MTDPFAVSVEVAELADAGIEEFRRGAPQAAHDLFERAARAAEPHPELAGQHLQILVNLATTAAHLGDHPAAIATLRRTLDAPGADPALRPAILLNLSQSLLETGAYDEAEAALTECHALAKAALPPPGAPGPDVATGPAAPATAATAPLAGPGDRDLPVGDTLAAAAGSPPWPGPAATAAGPYGIPATGPAAPDPAAPDAADPPSDAAELLMACLVALSTVAIQREDWPRAEQLTAEALEVVTRIRPDLVGRPLMNVAALALATGRYEPAEDFAEAALAACEAGREPAGAASVRLMLAQLYTATGRAEQAEPLLHAALAHTGPAGLTVETAVGWEQLGLLAALRGELDEAQTLYNRARTLLRQAGATPTEAALAVRRAEVAHLAGRPAEAEELLTHAADTFAALGLGLRRAQTHLAHAALLEQGGDPGQLARALDLAVPAALAIDAVRYGLAAGRQRDRWRRNVAEPALQLVFRLAARAGEALLVAHLIEVQCATTPILCENAVPRPDGPGPLGSYLDEPPPHAHAFAVAPPPRLLLTPDGDGEGDGEVALADRIALAEQRYGLPVRDTRTVPSW
ncbi:tetratricopeptide repeat protein [Streptomyces xiamenensis]|uniref:tetratricopeptide repeat protein n=1 Tax=Streptomyces xiamenensis TaxID=408015 RepID=UPI003D71DCEB